MGNRYGTSFLRTTQSFDFLPREGQPSLAVTIRAKFRIRKCPELGGLPPTCRILWDSRREKACNLAYVVLNTNTFSLLQGSDYNMYAKHRRSRAVRLFASNVCKKSGTAYQIFMKFE